MLRDFRGGLSGGRRRIGCPDLIHPWTEFFPVATREAIRGHPVAQSLKYFHANAIDHVTRYGPAYPP